MLASKAHIVTYRDDPADAEVVSHRLMARAGLIHKTGSGVYVYGPLLWRVLRKVQAVVSEELSRIGALEIQMPILQERRLWEESGRWARYVDSRTLFVTEDRKGTTYGLAPTAEEVVCDYARTSARSYRQLPLCLFQQNTKFRDEIRPRFGLLRVKEFVMKDAYSFDVDEAGLDVSYRQMRDAYFRIFRRLGLDAFAVDADPGDIGGSGSQEFMVAASAGEDAILVDPSGLYAANVEKATSRFAAPEGRDEAPRPLRVEDTPGVRTCAELHRFFPGVPPHRMVKTLIYVARHPDREDLWAVLIRGDQEVNEVKLAGHTGALSVRLATDEEVRAATGAETGFAGPIGLPPGVRVVADVTVEGMRNVLCGVNATDRHALDANPGRDFPEPFFADLRTAREGELSPVSEHRLQLRRGIEVGHIFKLGTRYSAPMNAVFVDAEGQERPFVMGCYGIGISRVAAAAVEQNHDGDGIVWPLPIAPFEVLVTAMNPTNEAQAGGARRVYEALQARGVDVMYDDRDLKPGVKLKDADLIGFPYKVIVGRNFEQTGKVELKSRRTGEVELHDLDTAAGSIAARVAAERRGLPSS